MRGPWARSFLAAIDAHEPPFVDVRDLDVQIGRVRGRVGECDVTLSAERVAPSVWAAMTRYAQGMGPLEEAVKGRLQSVHLDHLLAEDWGARLVPHSREVRRECSCDEGRACEHIAALAYAFADEIDRDASHFLLWRGCVDTGVEVEPAEQLDPWVGSELPEPAEPRVMPVAMVLKRLGPSGIQVGDEELVDLLQSAYEAFDAGK